MGNRKSMRVEAYLQRIRYEGPRTATAETLRRLQRCHMLAVPFENLDIHLGIPIVLSVPAFFEKIVTRRRGGFCYELNGLFAWLLSQLGFEVSLLSGRVFAGEDLSSDYDHLLLLVSLDELWIADVGFGDSFLEPLRLRDPQAKQRGSEYSIIEEGQIHTLRRREAANVWKPQYCFSLTPRGLDEFAARCTYQQTSPESHFTRKSVCSLATEGGRITLSKDRLIRTDGGGRKVDEVQDVDEYLAILARDFGIDAKGWPLDRLMR